MSCLSVSEFNNNLMDKDQFQICFLITIDGPSQKIAHYIRIYTPFLNASKLNSCNASKSCFIMQVLKQNREPYKLGFVRVNISTLANSTQTLVYRVFVLLGSCILTLSHVVVSSQIERIKDFELVLLSPLGVYAINTQTLSQTLQ